MRDDTGRTPEGGQIPKRTGAEKGTPAAFQQLRGLLGMTLPEPEARTVLQNIHDFKWLEAERAGFDVWAAIQPDCPLRAAALHWSRRYMEAGPASGTAVEGALPGAVSSTRREGSGTIPSGRLLEPACREDALAAAASGLVYLTADAELLPLALGARAKALRSPCASPWLVMPPEEGDPRARECALRLAADGRALDVLAAESGELQVMHTLTRESFAGIELSSVLLRDRLTLYPRDGNEVRQEYSAVGGAKTVRLLEPFLRAMFPATDCSSLAPLEPAEVADALPSLLAGALHKILVPGEEVLGLVVQENSEEVSRGILWGRRSEEVPAGVLAVTSARVALITAGRDGLPSAYGTTAVLIPLAACEAVAEERNAATGAIRATLRFGGGAHQASLRFHPRHGEALRAVLTLAESLIPVRPTCLPGGVHG